MALHFGRCGWMCEMMLWPLKSEYLHILQIWFLTHRNKNSIAFFITSVFLALCVKVQSMNPERRLYRVWKHSRQLVWVGSMAPLACPLCWRRMHGGIDIWWDGTRLQIRDQNWEYSLSLLLLYFEVCGFSPVPPFFLLLSAWRE